MSSMDQQYWDNVADNYEDEIFSSLDSDRKNLIKKYIQKCASKRRNACDFGCGVGIYLPILSRCFKHVYAFDLSPELVNVARKRNKSRKNITLRSRDLSRPGLKVPKVRFAVCANVLIVDSHKIRNKILANISRNISKDGHLLMVVPSLESALYTNARLFEWNLKSGMRQEDAIETGMKSEHDNGNGAVSNGLVNINGVTTKHYLQEELMVFLENHGFSIEEIEKVEYDWSTEFEKPPVWMKEPYPWDWMILAQKK